jgi:hypothetical protein
LTSVVIFPSGVISTIVALAEIAAGAAERALAILAAVAGEGSCFFWAFAVAVNPRANTIARLEACRMLLSFPRIAGIW